MPKAKLILEDGNTYEGFSFGAELSVPGEVGNLFKFLHTCFPHFFRENLPGLCKRLQC